MTKFAENSLLKPKLIPVQVPWRIDLSTPRLTLEAFEVSCDQPTELTFIAYTILKNEILPNSYKTRSLGSWIRDEDRYVKVTIFDAWKARLRGNYSDLNAINYNDFDCSALRGFYSSTKESSYDNWGRKEWDEYYESEKYERAIKEIQEDLEREKKEWLQTGICPNPSVYEIENSNWLEKDDQDAYLYPEHKHFIFVGHDAYVEVIGTALEWEYIDFLWHTPKYKQIKLKSRKKTVNLSHDTTL